MIGPWGWHGMMRGPGLLGGFLVCLFAIAIIALVVWLVVRLVRSTASQPASGAASPSVPPADPVLEVPRRRLAEGAITAQEFDELRQKLGV